MLCQQTIERSSKPKCQDATDRQTFLAFHLGQADLKEVDDVKQRSPSNSSDKNKELFTPTTDSSQSGQVQDPSQAQNRKMSFFSNDSSEGLSENCESLNAEIAALENSPLASVVKLDRSVKSFKLRSHAGLSGEEVVAEFTCAISSCSSSEGLTFFVFIGKTTLSFFDKNTFMNMAECAEQNGACQIVFLLDAEHTQLKDFRHTFKVIDADRVPSAQLQAMLKPELVAKDVQKTTKFYQMKL